MSLVDEYEAAVRSGSNPAYANYLAQILASNAGININSNQVTAAPSNLLPQHTDTVAASDSNFWGGSSIGGGLDAFVQGIMHPLDTLTGTNTAQMNADVKAGKGGISQAIGAVSDAVSGTNAAIKFITDIPRVATTVLGLILIIAGIFALSRGPAVQIVSSAVKTAVTS